ncbi:unnamed protein product [Caretta caretta]
MSCISYILAFALCLVFCAWHSDKRYVIALYNLSLYFVISLKLHNLSTWNSSFIREAFEFLLRKDVDLQLSVLKLLVSKVNGKELEEALEEFNDKVVNSSLIPSKWKGFALEALWDGKLRNEELYNETEFVGPWFQKRLRPFLAAVSIDILQCLQNETLGCVQYQAIVKGLDLEFKKMSHSTQEEVYGAFQLPYLKGLNVAESACVDGLNTSTAWLRVNFRNFSRHAAYHDFLSLNSRFNGLDVLSSLTVKQRAQLSATQGTLLTPEDVQKLMSFVTTSTVTEYIDELNRQASVSLKGAIRTTLLQHVLAAARPIFQKADDAEFVHWMDPRLAGLISGLNSTHVPLVFDHLESRNCSAINAVVTVLNNSITDFSNTTRQSIYHRILNMTAGSSLRCYATNTSFAIYLRETFQGFAAFLNLRDLASVIPASEIQKIVNTMAPAALADLLSSSDFLNDNNFLTVLLKNYKRRGAFIDLFNKRSIVDTLPNDTRMAILAGVWPAVLRSDNETVVDMWLSARLSRYFSFTQGNILNFSSTQNASCTAFRKIVGKLSNNMTAFKVSQQEIYNFTKAYLTATSARPRCYDASDPRTANWFAAYLGRSVRYSSADDVRSFINNNATVLQDLAINPDNLRLLNHTRIHKDVAELYATALFAKNSNFSLVNLPDELLCFARRSTAIHLLSPRASLSIIARINLHCGPSNTSEIKDPFTTDHQLATMLVAQITPFDARTLAALGQQAVGLTSGQILELRAQDIADPLALQSLGQVNGWDRGQSQGLMNKLISSNFTFDTAEAFRRLGTLVPGLPSHIFGNITADTAMKMAKNANFHRAIKKAPSYLKRAFVDKIISNSSSLNDILNNVPDDLVDQVPVPLLVLRDELLDLRKINEKQWSPEQAAVFLVDVLNATDNYADLSAAVLRGFQCGPASRLSPDKISSLVEQVRNKNAALSAHQLSCMAKILAAKNLTANFTSYPPDVLLFFDFTQVQNHTCKEFYSLASQGNPNLLPNGSAQRTQLLNNALVCLGGVSNTLSKEQLSSLGALVCDMDPAAITDSDPQILENLKLCPDLAGPQKAALNTLLSRGESQDGAPLSWDLGSLQSLGSLTLYLNRTIWRSVKEDVRKAFFRSVVAGYQTQSASQKEKTMLLLKSIGSASPSSPRSKRATEQCKSEPITASTIQDPLFIVYYDMKGQFDACLSNEVLKANLVPLLEHPLTEEYLDVMKSKLSEIFPAGIPEDQLKLFGQLSRRYEGNEISTWRVTSGDTLSALLDPSGGSWKASGAKQLITRYTDLGGTLTGPLLQKIGGRDLCGLDDDQINKISSEAIGTAGKLDISSCSQSKKDRLYAKARDAFASQTGTSAYYPLIQPYLGGAPVKDLEHLAGSNIAMDIDTFTSLKPNELQNLSVQNVKNLLGVNLPDLNRAENHPSVTSWIQRHYQTELDSILGIGLHGGMSEPVSMATTNSGTSATPDTSTTPPATTYNVTTPHNTTSLPATTYNVTTPHNTTSLPATTYNVTIPHDTTSLPATTYNVTTPHDTTSLPATTYNVTIPHDTTSLPATTYNVTIPHDTTSLPATTYNVTTPHDTTTPPATTYNVTTPHDTTTPPATTYNVTTPHNTTSLPATTYNVTIPHDTTSLPATTYNVTTPHDTTTPPATTYNVTTPHDTTTPPATTYNVTTPHNTTSLPATTYNVTIPHDTTSPPATTYNVTIPHDTTSPPVTTYNVTTPHDTTTPPVTTYNVTTPHDTISPPATTYNVTTPHDTTSPPAIITPLATIHNTTTPHNTTSLPATTYNVTTPHNTTSLPATTYNVTTPHNTTSLPATTYNVTIPHNTTSLPATTYNVTIPHNTTSPPATTYNVTTPHDTAFPPAIITPLATIHNTTTPHNTTSLPATTYNVTIPHNTTSLPATTYNVTTPHDTTSLPALVTPLATIHNTTTSHFPTSPPATTHNITILPATIHTIISPTAIITPTSITHNTTSLPATSPPSPTHNTTFITSPKKPVTPPQPTPNSTSPSPTSPGKTAVPPAPATTMSSTTMITPKTATKKPATNTTWPPKPLPPGYIILEPVTASASKPAFRLLDALSATIGISVLSRFL